MQFTDIVWEYYHQNSRILPWRVPEKDGTFDPYKILVSEMMLQQTQVPRVIPKYKAFLKTFPTVESLADAPLQAVLQAWQGLGYNRRAKFLREAAVKLVNVSFPDTIESLILLPGVGKNTAAALLVYAYNQPNVFIETNIRTVYIHHFFNDADQVSDKEILPIVESTLDIENPREWYWALMDYGTYIKSQGLNPSRLSRHYVKQSQFEGSVRQMRGEIIRLLADGPKTYKELSGLHEDPRFEVAIRGLTQEAIVLYHDGCLQIAD